MNTPLPNYYAFFDVDGTLINIKSTHSFLYMFCKDKYKNKLIALTKYCNYRLKIKIYELLHVNRNYLNTLYYRNFKGASKEHIKKLADQWLNKILSEKNIFKESSLQELKQHQANNAEVILVSGSFEECLLPLAEKLNIKWVLATKLESATGICTGRIADMQMIGDGKAKAINTFLQQQGFTSLNKCYAYGDHISDLPMLMLVGNPTVINNDKKLTDCAKQKGWRVL